METGAITGHIDVAQIVLYAFWAFFAVLVLYLHREGKREGYPLIDESRPGFALVGFPEPPPAKTYRQAHQPDMVVDGGRPDTRTLNLAPVAPWPGAPLEPTGNAMLDGVGPGSYAERADLPDVTRLGQARIVPTRVASDFSVAPEDPNPIGMTVIAGDGAAAGIVRDVWIDRAEYVARYFEVETGPKDALVRVLLPVNFARVHGDERKISVRAIYAQHFPDVPKTRSPDQVTLLEEDKIMGYFGAGTFYANPARMEPIL